MKEDNPADNTATDKDNLTPQYDVSVTKDDNTTTAVPGQSTTYQIVVKNTSGPSAASNVQVSDPLPTGVISATWSGNGHSGTGALNDTIASLVSASMASPTVRPGPTASVKRPVTP